MSVRIGDLRRRLTIERANDTSDGAGGFLRSWVNDGEVFAQILPRRRREALDTGRVIGMVTHVITVRWRDDIDGSVRFKSNGLNYRVRSVEDADPERRFLDCWCEEEQP
ncbi:MAG: phage head closure protein [Pseudomonadota bacterium]